MRLHVLTLACAVITTGCYTAADVGNDVNASWRGRARVELEAQVRIPPAAVLPQPDGTSLLRWSRKAKHVTLPSGHLDLKLTPTSFDLDAAVQPGTVSDVEVDVMTALVDPGGAILRLDGWSLSWGLRASGNVRHGLVMGLSGGVGRLDTTGTPMPSLAMYIGGMLSPRHALVGTYQFVNGKAGGDFGQGHAWGIAAQYWPLERVNVRVGPAMVVDNDPAADAALSFGAVAAASYALVRAGSFVLDLRFDATVSTASAFGTLGVGVNVN